jgi:hypothetical protein
MDLHPLLKREYQGSRGVRISMWQPRYVKEGEDGVELLDVEAVIDRDVRTESVHLNRTNICSFSDHQMGSATNTTKTLHLPLDFFATFKVVTLQSEGLLGIAITYIKLAEFLDKAQRL